MAEVFLLGVHVGRNVLAQEREKGGNRKRLVAVADQLIVDGFVVEVDLQEAGDGVDGDHEEDANDTIASKHWLAVFY